MTAAISTLSFWLVLARLRLLLPAVASPRSCRWIEDDDFVDRIHRGDEIFCNAPVRNVGESYCAMHRSRVYAAARSQYREIRHRNRVHESLHSSKVVQLRPNSMISLSSLKREKQLQ
jgi:hypothetical protein